ncbi:cysteine-rich receptor-like protein kinase 10 isoform X1 [Triticum dicoccoides]|uniref:cysteine-rich receptor-like protein kinase 10 isoform X1 n=1 Tax=Triticum dicoccoides TaxID=85692 RepID=UPI0018913161|nr:cysteine-rich receptor-like protein kinase 10 isoform X1 [Triticum dicoccoides]
MAAIIILLLLLLSAPSLYLVAADDFCDNVKAVAAILSKNASASPVHFASATYGQAPDVVSALALCGGDILDGSACAGCITSWFDKQALNQTQCARAGSNYRDCIIAYGGAADNILGAPSNATGGRGDNTPPFEDWSIRNVSVSGGAGAVPLVVGLTRELLAATAEKAAAVAPSRYATGVMDFQSVTTYPRVYSQSRCTPDLPADECLACLRRLLGMVNSSMSLRMGGQMGVTRCYFRYDAFQFYSGQPLLSLPAPAPAAAPTPNKSRRSMLWVIPVVVVPLTAAAFLLFICYYRRRKGSRYARRKMQEKNSEFSFFDFAELVDATSNFSEENKLGEGGFGTVYKGQLPDGLEIAVKRLDSLSRQGFIEFQNELQLIAKLQHINLVRLLGCCSQEEEKILVYEYLPNKSLDHFIFDEDKRALLDWSKLVAIIEGIAHGLLYLHKHSRLLVIHRDLKPSNILLDSEMNPKISDFGLAKIFSSTDTEANTTRRVVGTYGYMAPEYASKGIFSIKSDVFSFGVIILEILSGKQNSGQQQCGDFINLLGHAWQLWEDGKWFDLVDSSFVPHSHSAKMMRCINVALLCVQENAVERPTMGDVVSMVGSETMILDEPKQPAYINVRVGNEQASTAPESDSISDMTLSVTTPR